MVQREVAARLAAGPWSEDLWHPECEGRLVRQGPHGGYCAAERLLAGAAGRLGLVLLTAWDDPAAVHAGQDRGTVFGLVDRLFAQRRKTVRHALAAAWGPAAADEVLASAGSRPPHGPNNSQWGLRPPRQLRSDWSRLVLTRRAT